MSWAGLANNQTVSFNNLQNAVDSSIFTAAQAIPASNEQITKADALLYVYVQAIPSKSNSQLVVKSDLVSSVVTVFISICGENADGSGNVNVYAYSSVAVDTGINVPVKWTGTSFSELLGTINISSGQSCGTAVLSGAGIGEGYSSMTFTGDISPTSYGTQDYEQGSDVDSPFCAYCF
jgi:hypothetical protein